MIQDTSLFLCGDVMTGRGIDQILSHSVSPELHESYVRSALGYVELAESVNGAIPRQVDCGYVWGDALRELERRQPSARIINLETAVTLSDDWQPKGINYRMHPGNLACLTAAHVDCCVLANNHVLDWGPGGLTETLTALRPITRLAGAGENAATARAAAEVLVPGGRVLVFAAGTQCSGIPAHWEATVGRPGVWLLPELSEATAELISAHIESVRRPGDIVVFSLHWGSNWGYAVPPTQRRFAHELIDRGQVDLVHGHSSHHPKGIEVYQDKLILYGCGDFINDYEGIHGHEEFRADLALMYFPVVRGNGQLLSLSLVPLQIRRFCLNYAGEADRDWLHESLDRECRKFGCGIVAQSPGAFGLQW